MKLKDSKETFESWVSEGTPPTAQEILEEFQELKAIPEVAEWIMLTAEELMSAGLRQQHLHLLNNMIVDLPKDKQVAASSSCH